MQVSLPPLDAEPPISDADDARFDVRREKEVLIDEGLSTSNGGGGGDGDGGDGGMASPGAGGMGGDASSNGAAAGLGAAVSNGGGRDPTSLEATVRRLVDAPEDPVVDKYVRMGYKRDAVIFGECFFFFFSLGSPSPHHLFFSSKTVEQRIQPPTRSCALACSVSRRLGHDGRQGDAGG